MATTVEPGPAEGKEKKAQVANKNYKVDIYADDSSGKLEFYIQPGDEVTRQHMHGKHLDFPNGPAWYDIEYNLHNRYSSVKTKFKESEPICVAPGAACPAKGSGNGSNGQIESDRKGDKKLTVENKNQNPEQFAYTLFFADENDNDVGELDPIYDNGGGGHQAQ
jgi:hypothetical protein